MTDLVYPLLIDKAHYTGLITSEHRHATKFLATIDALIEALVTNQNLVRALPSFFDLDTAIGAQLDRVGERIGRSRYLKVPLRNVYFSLDVPGLGLDQAVWYERTFSATSGLVRLDDYYYRLTLYAQVAANQWDGTIPGAYRAYDAIFKPLGYHVLIQDYGDMTMAVMIFSDGPINAIIATLFSNGEFALRPVGTRVIGYQTPSIPGRKIFALDVVNDYFGGLDDGVWEIDVTSALQPAYMLDNTGAPILDNEDVPYIDEMT